MIKKKAKIHEYVSNIQIVLHLLEYQNYFFILFQILIIMGIGTRYKMVDNRKSEPVSKLTRIGTDPVNRKIRIKIINTGKKTRRHTTIDPNI